MCSANICSGEIDNAATGRKGTCTQALAGQNGLSLARGRTPLPLPSYCWKLIRKINSFTSELLQEISSVMQTLKLLAGHPVALMHRCPIGVLNFFCGAHPYAQQEAPHTMKA